MGAVGTEGNGQRGMLTQREPEDVVAWRHGPRLGNNQNQGTLGLWATDVAAEVLFAAADADAGVGVGVDVGAE